MTLAYVHSNDVSHSWHESVVGLIAHDMGGSQRLLRGGWIAMRCGTDGLVAARNKTAEQFVKDERSDWLLWTDTDMGFAPDTIDRLMEVADAGERPIVGGLCFAQREMAVDGMGGYRTVPNPTIFDWVSTDEAVGFKARSAYPVNTVVRCAGTGSALVLIHRSVFERVAEKAPGAWYDRIPNPSMGGQPISEDLSFCLRAGALEIPVHVHTGVRATHHKDIWLAEADYWRQAIPPPATERVAVLVPVMRRPQNAEPFMRSLRASTGLATCYAICDSDDAETETAWRAAGATVYGLGNYANPAGTFAQKVNVGFKLTAEPWVFICGDDVRFHAGWLDHAEAVAEDRFHVIGTNDVTNPRVMRGEHATHLLIRRAYVEMVGASWDQASSTNHVPHGAGVIAHEGYRHWFVDDEIVQAAKQRGVFAMALGSVVEHLHPLFGKADADEVYQLGATHAKKDQAHYKERLHLARAHR